MGILILLLDVYSYIVLGAVLLSWLGLDPENPLQRIADTLVEPVLAPIRKVLPTMAGFDLSPLVLFFGIKLVRGVLVSRLDSV
ncbi:MAG: YggT family protein [Polyangiaceae bacterium]|nr:YggT family protein [Polyangiaceae bacterium]MCW5789490.1 YggT family protein [Polyangiaceae bacterium]